MNHLNLKLVVVTTTVFVAIAYLVCVAFQPIFPSWAMYTTDMWYSTFPGFSWTPGGVLLGLIEAALYGLFGSALFVGLYNLFADRFTAVRA